MLDNKLKIEITPDGKRTKVSLIGIVDEDSVLTPIEQLKTPVVINFKGLTQMNSVGIRLFMKAMEAIQDNGLFFEECTSAIVRQMSMVPSFQGKAKVLSIYAPFTCSDCEDTKMLLLTPDQFPAGKLVLTTPFRCTVCGKGEMEFDANPQKYFAFASDAK